MRRTEKLKVDCLICSMQHIIMSIPVFIIKYVFATAQKDFYEIHIIQEHCS